MAELTESSRTRRMSITRRDMVSGILIGAGGLMAGLPLASCSRTPAGPPPNGKPTGIPATLNESWTGPGGIGDYAYANGNTHMTVNAAHALRDGDYKLESLPKVDEDYDLVIVGSGIAGLCSAFYYQKARPNAKILMIDNNGIFGGEAKQNEVEVDGHHLYGPQGSNMCVWPATAAENLNFFWHKAWREIGLPMGHEPDAPKWIDAPGMPLPKNHYSAMMVVRDRWPQAQFFPDPKNPGKLIHAMNPWQDGYKSLPFPEKAKEELRKVDEFRPTKPDGFKTIEEWMDTMTYRQYLEKEVGVTSQEVFDYLSPEIASYGTGMGCETVSALAARDFLAPGTATQAELDAVDARRDDPKTKFEPISFPGGNSGIARHFVKKLVPDAIAGEAKFKDIIYGAVNWDALDRDGQPVRIRTAHTALAVHHEGDPATAKATTVTYINNNTGEKRRVRSKALIMATGQWVNKYIIRDAPQEIRDAMDQFDHAPMLIVNVALRNWEFINKLGAPALRWFEGIGWFTNIRAPMAVDGAETAPADPSKPTMLTFYIPYNGFAKFDFDLTQAPVRAHAIAARTALFDMSFADIESKVRDQLTKSFGELGFDADRDIAAIITNRWGHAYVIPQVGFFYGKDGKPAPIEVVKKGYGRIRFGHSETSGIQVWHHACDQGERAARQVLELT